MVRISSENIPVFFSFHESYTRELVKHKLVNAPYSNLGIRSIVVNFADYVSGCFSTDCYSKYLPQFTSDVFHNSKLFIENAAIAGKLTMKYLDAFIDTLMLFGVECGMLAVWLNSFMKESYLEACKLKAQMNAGLSDENKDLESLSHVMTFRVFPTLPVNLIEALNGFEKVNIAVMGNEKPPAEQDVLELIGWLMLKYELVCTQDIRQIYSSIAVDACLADSFSLYLYQMFSAFKEFDEVRESGDRLTFTLYDLKEEQ